MSDKGWEIDCAGYTFKSAMLSDNNKKLIRGVVERYPKEHLDQLRELGPRMCLQGTRLALTVKRQPDDLANLDDNMEEAVTFLAGLLGMT